MTRRYVQQWIRRSDYFLMGIMHFVLAAVYIVWPVLVWTFAPTFSGTDWTWFVWWIAAAAAIRSGLFYVKISRSRL